MQWLTEQLRLQCPGDPCHNVIIRSGTKLYDRYSWDNRKSPSAKAFECLDSIKAAVEQLEHPTSVKVTVDRIQLVELEPAEDSDDDKLSFTAVCVKVAHPAAALRYLVVRAEGLSKIEFADWHWRDITYRRKPRRCHAMAGATVRPQQMDAALVVL